MKDNFSLQSESYARYRPVYPKELFDFILSFVTEKKLAWDCGTGNGQSAAVLCKYFDQVFATDISAQQIEQAFKENNIKYALEPAEHISLPDNSVDLITVSQALHWFEFDQFYSEVRRVSTQNGIIAVWTYSLLQTDPITDQLIHHYHFETLQKYWDKERMHVDDGYTNIPFPFKEIPVPAFSIKLNWNLEDLEGYFNTWSALQKFINTNNYNPVKELIYKIRQNWPAEEMRSIIFPLKVKMARVY